MPISTPPRRKYLMMNCMKVRVTLRKLMWALAYMFCYPLKIKTDLIFVCIARGKQWGGGEQLCGWQNRGTTRCKQELYNEHKAPSSFCSDPFPALHFVTSAVVWMVCYKGLQQKWTTGMFRYAKDQALSQMWLHLQVLQWSLQFSHNLSHSYLTIITYNYISDVLNSMRRIVRVLPCLYVLPLSFCYAIVVVISCYGVYVC